MIVCDMKIISDSNLSVDKSSFNGTQIAVLNVHSALAAFTLSCQSVVLAARTLRGVLIALHHSSLQNRDEAFQMPCVSLKQICKACEKTRCLQPVVFIILFTSKQFAENIYFFCFGFLLQGINYLMKFFPRLYFLVYYF